jgi:hypothetical protein
MLLKIRIRIIILLIGFTCVGLLELKAAQNRTLSPAEVKRREQLIKRSAMMRRIYKKRQTRNLPKLTLPARQQQPEVAIEQKQIEDNSNQNTQQLVADAEALLATIPQEKKTWMSYFYRPEPTGEQLIDAFRRFKKLSDLEVKISRMIEQKKEELDSIRRWSLFGRVAQHGKEKENAQISREITQLDAVHKKLIEARKKQEIMSRP